MKIVILDADDRIRDHLKRMIMHKFPQYHVAAGATIQEAAGAIEEGDVRIVFADGTLPEMNTLEFIATYKAQQPHIHWVITLDPARRRGLPAAVH